MSEQLTPSGPDETYSPELQNGQMRLSLWDAVSRGERHTLDPFIMAGTVYEHRDEREVIERMRTKYPATADAIEAYHTERGLGYDEKQAVVFTIPETSEKVTLERDVTEGQVQFFGSIDSPDGTEEAVIISGESGEPNWYYSSRGTSQGERTGVQRGDQEQGLLRARGIADRITAATQEWLDHTTS